MLSLYLSCERVPIDEEQHRDVSLCKGTPFSTFYFNASVHSELYLECGLFVTI